MCDLLFTKKTYTESSAALQNFIKSLSLNGGDQADSLSIAFLGFNVFVGRRTKYIAHSFETMSEVSPIHTHTTMPRGLLLPPSPDQQPPQAKLHRNVLPHGEQ